MGSLDRLSMEKLSMKEDTQEPWTIKLPEMVNGEEIHFKTYSTFHSRNGPFLGTFYLSNFRILFKRHQDSTANPGDGRMHDTHIQLGKIFKITKFVTKHDTMLEVWCKDFQVARFSFVSETNACEKAFKILHKLAFLPSIDKAFAFQYKLKPVDDELEDDRLGTFDGWKAYDVLKECARMGIPDENWRITYVNQFYRLCSSYPNLLVVPAIITDMQLKEAAHFRMRERVPALSWRSPRSGAAISRSSQPKVGLGRIRSTADEELIAAIRTANPKHPNLPLIVTDARSRIDAVANQAMGAGSEGHHYENTEVNFLGIGNAVRVAEAANRLLQLVHSEDHGVGTDWLIRLSNTRWLEYISLLISSSVRIARSMEKGYSIHVHCSDGWDRTAQLVSLTMLLSDPYYRTIDGFIVLIEKEWLSFGHKFEDRMGHASVDHDSKERSPIFMQWIDCVYQLIVQFPAAFEFNEHFIISLLDAVFSLQYGTFLGDNERSRVTSLLSDRTVSFWSEVHVMRHTYTNVYYNSHPGLILPCSEIRYLQFWTGYYLRWSVSSSPHHVEMAEWDAKILKTVQDKQVLQQTLSQTHSINDKLKKQIFSLVNDKVKMSGEITGLWQKVDSLMELLQRKGDTDLLSRAQALVDLSSSDVPNTALKDIIRESARRDSLDSLSSENETPNDSPELNHKTNETDENNGNNNENTNENNDENNDENNNENNGENNENNENDSESDRDDPNNTFALAKPNLLLNKHKNTSPLPFRRFSGTYTSNNEDLRKLSRSRSDMSGKTTVPVKTGKTGKTSKKSNSYVLTTNIVDNLIHDIISGVSECVNNNNSKKEESECKDKSECTDSTCMSSSDFFEINDANNNNNKTKDDNNNSNTNNNNNTGNHAPSLNLSTSSDEYNGNDEGDGKKNRETQHGARRWRQMLDEKNNLLTENIKLKDANSEMLMRLRNLEKTLENERDRSRRLAASKKSLISNLANISEGPSLSISVFGSNSEFLEEIQELPQYENVDYFGDMCVLGGTDVRVFPNYTAIDRERCEIDLSCPVDINDRWCAGCDVMLKGSQFVMVRVGGKSVPHCKTCAHALVSLSQQIGRCYACSRSFDFDASTLAPSPFPTLINGEPHCASCTRKFRERLKSMSF